MDKQTDRLTKSQKAWMDGWIEERDSYFSESANRRESAKGGLQFCRSL